MKHAVGQKLHSRRGASALLAVLLVLTVAMAVMALLPAVRRYAAQAGSTACAAALASAGRALTDAAISEGGTLDRAGAEAALARAMPGRETLCPSGGDVYLAEAADGSGWELVCGKHGSGRRRTALNAAAALERLEAVLARSGEAPETAELTLNGAALAVALVRTEPGLRRGTGSTSGYEGTAAFYMAEGTDVSYFCYADEDYCAVWRRGGDWTVN